MYIREGNYELINNLPAYGSLIIAKASGGIGGEIFIREEEKEFFNITGNIIHEQGKTITSSKQLYELHSLNEYTFDFENLFKYLLDIKSEFQDHTFNEYKPFERPSDVKKRVNSDGWETRKQLVMDSKDDLSFIFYLKKSTDNRCFFGSADAFGIYTQIIAYTVIPNYTTLTIQRIDKEDGGAKFIFRLFFNENSADLSEHKKRAKVETILKKDKSIEELIHDAVKKELSKSSSTPTSSASNPHGVFQPRKRISNDYERDETISAAVKKRADGKCDLCGIDAPFLDEYDQPFLEEHHVDWLMNGGADSIENAVALCPNCHRKIHIRNDETDVEKLLLRLKEYAEKYATIIEAAKK
ncbi:MAG: HNH endonuclease [Aminipila sp.]